MIREDLISEKFKRDGYYRAKQVFSKAEMDELEAEFDRIVEQILQSGAEINARWKGAAVDKIDKNKSTKVFHTHNVQKYSALWMRALLNPEFLSVATEILGGDIVLHHTKLFQKPSGLGAPFPMHQDWAYFPMMKDSMIAGIVHVSDATDEMGCLRVYPGSHRLGRMAESDGRTLSESLKPYPLEDGIPVECERGDVVFFHYFTIHGSKPNTSSHNRKTVLAQLHSGDDQLDESHNHAYEGLALCGFNNGMTRGGAFRSSV